ncbi:LysO family transporter [uncultured Bacteroides sp.]|uniref:LysO family transporter n=1 Tax=uncultured Bacteroides sp. TaxID=162156 RepID=UPI0025FF5058|nr:LysO family transporter [uncultured Bacteroides sp.]
MFIFISIMAIGAIIGYSLRSKKDLSKVSTLIQIVVCLLLFILGLSVGGNKLIISNLTYYCEQAAIISVLSLVGSSVAAMLVFNLFFKKGAGK